MKLIVLLLSLVLMCLALKSVKGIQPPLDDALLRNSSVMAFGTDADIDGETGLVIAQSSLNTFELIMKGVEFFTKNKLVTTITSFLGPLGSILGIVGDIMGIFNKGPDIEKLFAEQTAFINESFIAMSNQVIFKFTFTLLLQLFLQ